ncbi:MAG TPA: sulfatase [Verrucomicrobiales bacterium]|nr:sulfatase [Verrucomicrobiales bacterium]
MKHLLAFFLVVAVVFSAEAQKRPNIVMLISDDQAWTDYSFMGHDQIDTPHLDKLASESVVFRRGYVPTALCRPSLMTMATGLYASQHRVTGNDPSPANYSKTPEVNAAAREKLISNVDRVMTVPRLLGTKGYLSHQSGKWWEGNFSRGGFTHGMTRGFPQPGGRHGDDGLKIGRKGLAPVLDFIDEAVGQEKPFFVWYAPFMPHTPHTPPARLLEKYKAMGLSNFVARYYAMCEWFDETCGELVGHLDKKGVRDNTLIVYVCDNGWIQKPSARGYAPRSKQTPYEGGVRTPIMFSWPGTLKPADRKELVSSIDLVPTMLAAAGVAVPKNLPGLNLLENMKTGQAIERDTIYGESFAHDIANMDNHEDSLLFRWCIRGDWKLLLTYDGVVNRYATTHPRLEKRPQLFNLINDPAETKNLAGENPKLVRELSGALNRWYEVKERNTITVFSD